MSTERKKAANIRKATRSSSVTEVLAIRVPVGLTKEQRAKARRVAQASVIDYIEGKFANEILKKHEDANEMHFYEVDRQWIIEAMEEYAALRQTLVSSNFSSESDHSTESIYLLKKPCEPS